MSAKTNADGHYFSSHPDAPTARRTVRVDVGGAAFDLLTDTGVFSRDRLDPGTQVLLRHMDFPADAGNVLDLGCGYGPIAFALALRCPNARIWAVDVNERALELVRDNAKNLGVTNVVAASPESVADDIKFDAIYSNPPIRIGKSALHELLLYWLPKLAENSLAHLVVQRNLGADSLANWLADNQFSVRRIASKRGYRVLQVNTLNSTE